MYVRLLVLLSWFFFFSFFGCILFCFNPHLKTFFHCFLEKKEGERETEVEKHWCERNSIWLPPICTSTDDGTWNLGMCPDWESNTQPFGVWDTSHAARTANYIGQQDCILKNNSRWWCKNIIKQQSWSLPKSRH